MKLENVLYIAKQLYRQTYGETDAGRTFLWCPWRIPRFFDYRYWEDYN